MRARSFFAPAGGLPSKNRQGVGMVRGADKPVYNQWVTGADGMSTVEMVMESIGCGWVDGFLTHYDGIPSGAGGRPAGISIESMG